MRKTLYALLFFIIIGACNKTDSTTQKYLSLQKTLEQIVVRKKADNQLIVEEMKRNLNLAESYRDSSMIKMGKQKKAILHKAIQLTSNAEALIQQINILKNKLIQESGGLLQDGSYMNPQATEAVSILKNSEEFNQLFDTIVLFKSHVINDIASFTSQATANNQAMQETTRADFEDATSAAALAMLTNMQVEIRQTESQWLKLAPKRIRQVEGRIESKDKFFPIIIAQSDQVMDGEIYKAEMFMASPTDITQTMIANGEAVEIVDGIGKVKFKVGKPGKYTWTGAITVEKPGGGDTTFVIKEVYTVIASRKNKGQ